MYFSLNWLKDYLPDLPEIKDYGEFVEMLNTTVGEVDGFEVKKAPPKSVILAKIVKLDKHPNADKLKLVTLSDGKKELPQVVCGGTNIVEGQIVPLAQPGTVLTTKEGRPFEIKKGNIRGEDSNGMLCGTAEVGLSNEWESYEIMILPNVASKYLGKPLNDFLGIEEDVIFEVDNKSLSSRPDLTGHLGYARELYSIFTEKMGNKVNFNDPVKEMGKLDLLIDDKEIEKSEYSKAELKISNPKKARRIIYFVMTGVKVCDSPTWLKNRLAIMGQKPVNSLVDISNYVMFDIGQPSHAFDLAKIANMKVDVRDAKKGEKMLLLNDKEIEVTPEDLVIADSEKTLGLIGIMGGKHSGTEEQTRNIMFLVDNFDPAETRRASIRHDCRSDASSRFEKNIHPENAHIGLMKILKLIREIHPEAKFATKAIDVYPAKLPEVIIKTDAKEILCKTGLDIPEKKVISILESLGCTISKKGEKLEVVVPFWRATKDIDSSEDLGEEVMRIYGIENIELVAPEINMEPVGYEDSIVDKELVRTVLSGFGCIEILNRPFTTEAKMKRAFLDPNKAIKVKNPVSGEATHMRYSLIPGILEAISDNVKRTGIDFNIFEVGRTYMKNSDGKYWNEKAGLPNESTLFVVGLAKSENKNDTFEDNPTLKAKAQVKELLRYFGLEANFTKVKNGNMDIMVKGNTRLGQITTTTGTLKKSYDLEGWDIALINIDLDILLKEKITSFKAPTISPYPAVKRDLSVFVPQDIKWRDIKDIVGSVSPLVNNIEPWDIYEKEGSKTLTFSFTLQSPEKTLEEQDISSTFKKIIENLGKKGIKLTAEV